MTLTGTGGIGKTRLGMEVAHCQLDASADGLAWSLNTLARVRLDAQDDPAIIRSLLEEGLVLWRELGDPRGTAYAVFLSGQLALRQGDVAKAGSSAEESVKLYKEIGDRLGTTESLILLARVVTFQGDYEAAHRIYGEGLAIARETNHKWVIASCLEGLASLVAAQEQIGISLEGIPWEQVLLWAAQLWGAAEALREAVGVPIPFAERANYEQAVAAARAQLGEKAFAARWGEGRRMTPEQALAAQGRETVPSPATSVPAPLTYPAGLTAREEEVLRLVAIRVSIKRI